MQARGVSKSLTRPGEVRRTAVTTNNYGTADLVPIRLGISPDTLSGNLKDRKTTKLRQMVATFGIERWE